MLIKKDINEGNQRNNKWIIIIVFFMVNFTVYFKRSVNTCKVCVF